MEMMMSEKWYYGNYRDRVTLSPDSDGEDSVCHIYDGPEQESRGRMIAAAPELFDLARWLDSEIRLSDSYAGVPSGAWEQLCRQAHAKARAAIARATGK